MVGGQDIWGLQMWDSRNERSLAAGPRLDGFLDQAVLLAGQLACRRKDMTK